MLIYKDRISGECVEAREAGSRPGARTKQKTQPPTHSGAQTEPSMTLCSFFLSISHHTGDELLSDSYNVKDSEDGFFIEVDGKWTEVGDVDVDIGANPSAEEGGEDEGVDGASRKVVDIIDAFRLVLLLAIRLLRAHLDSTQRCSAGCANGIDSKAVAVLIANRLVAVGLGHDLHLAERSRRSERAERIAGCFANVRIRVRQQCLSDTFARDAAFAKL